MLWKGWLRAEKNKLYMPNAAAAISSNTTATMTPTPALCWRAAVRVSSANVPVAGAEHVCTGDANGRGILNLEPSRFGVALEPLEIASKFGRGLVAQIAILLQQLADDVFQLGWYCRIQPYRRQRSSIEDTVEDGC